MIGSAISAAWAVLAESAAADLWAIPLDIFSCNSKWMRQTEAFQTASSVMKARHDAAMAAIRNIS